MEIKTEFIAFKTTKEIGNLIRTVAEKNSISISNLIVIAVLDYLRENKLRDKELRRTIIK